MVATVTALCLMGVPAAHWQAQALALGWRWRLGVIGTGLVLLGATAWVAAFGLLFNGALLGAWGLLWPWAAWSAWSLGPPGRPARCSCRCGAGRAAGGQVGSSARPAAS